MLRDTRARRLTIWLATLAYAVLASGLPLPAGGGVTVPPATAAAKRLAGKDCSRPFPCRDKPCGCSSAEQCFANCCCNTPAELLAWARANRVAPGLIAKLERRVAAIQVISCSAVTSCCAVKSCCAATRPTSCCAERPAAPPCPQECEAADGGSQGVVVLAAMLACRGIAEQWLALGGGPPPPPVVAVLRILPLVVACSAGDASGSMERAEPDAPPPRVA